MKQVKSTNKQRGMLLDCHRGVGFLVYHSADKTTTETEFFINKYGIPCYLGTGKPIVFEISYSLGEELDTP